MLTFPAYLPIWKTPAPTVRRLPSSPQVAFGNFSRRTVRIGFP